MTVIPCVSLDSLRTLPMKGAKSPYDDIWDTYRDEVRRPRPGTGVTRKTPVESDEADSDPGKGPEFGENTWYGFHIDGDKRYFER